MKHTAVLCAALCLVVLLPVQVLHAQHEQDAGSQRVRLEMRDGTVLIGTVEAEDDETVRFRTTTGLVVTVEKADVVARRTLAPASSGRYRYADPNRTRLLFGPTARTLRSGEGYVALYEVFFPFVGVGVADVATLAGGITIIPGLSDQVVYFAPKLTVSPRRSLDLAAGAIVGTSTGGGEGYGGLLYGVGTYGSTDDAVTLGVGFGFVEGDVSDQPVFMLGLEKRIATSLKLISENYLVPGIDEALVLSGGVRLVYPRLTVDFALVTSPSAFDDTSFPFVPLVNLMYVFGQK